MNFKKLTLPSGKAILVNMDSVTEIYDRECGCAMYFNTSMNEDQATVNIKESMEELEHLLAVTK